MSTRRESGSQRRDQADGNGRVPSRQGSGLANVHSDARENRSRGNAAQATAGRSLSRTTSPTPNGGSDLGGASATHGGSLRWGFLHPDGAVASPRVGRGGGGFSAQWFNNDPALPGGVRSSKIGSHMGMSGLQPVLDYAGMSGNVEQSGAIMPMELPSQAIAGGHTTRDLGKTLSKTQMGDSMTKPFTEEVVSYKHGDNIILHQWADTGDLLVNCQSPTPQSFICQYGVSKGTMAWTLDVSRTCDKFWFGVTTDKDLDCNGWISDCDAAFMVSEEGEVPESTYDNYVPRSVRDRSARPSMVQQNDSPPRWVRLKSFAPAAGIQGIWASVAFVLDMDKGELHMQVRNGDGDTSPKCKLFRGLPRGFTLFPCLSMCNAGQVIFMKYGE